MQTATAARTCLPATAIPAAAPALSPELAQAGTRRTLAKGAELFAEGDPSIFFYKVVSGTVRTVKLLADGRRQIDAFHVAGDMLGLDQGACYRLTGEAVEPALVIAYRRSDFASLMRRDPAATEALMTATLANLDRAHEHMVLLGRKTASERMASFLLDLAQRLSCTDRVRLPMQRTDIADHLGLTIETVSRTLAQLVQAKLIRLADGGRTIILANRDGLQLLAA
jgi:CRP/FNR family nitrogen fixation transcriptional regulator